MNIWAGIFAPKGTPKPIVDKLAAALDKSLDDPGVKAKVAELGGSIPPKSERTPANFSRFVKGLTNPTQSGVVAPSTMLES
jgi:tripartite-type tricarboxylate transporter receptor subunit TctC